MGQVIQMDQKSRTVKKRLGRFFVPTGFFHHHAKNIATTLAMIQFLPVRVEHRADIDAFEMTGLSDSFDEIEYGVVVPMYELQIRSHDDGAEYVKVVRKTDG